MSRAAPPFVHLHVHSEYSILDGACRIPALVQKAAQLEMPAVSLTDHGSLAGAVELYREARKAGVKPIVGCEVYVADDQFLEWQIYLVRKIAVVLGLTPQDLGVTFDVNRSTSETQIQISEDRGLRPMMSLLQEYLTEEVVWDAAHGGQDNNLAFRFTALNLKESTAKANINQIALGGVPWRFINEARISEGREPIPELENKLIMATSIGAVDLSDVPTVREVLEMQTKRNEPAPAPKSDKTVFVEGVSVLRQEIRLDELPEGTPAEVRSILGRCLARDLDRRVVDMRELVAAFPCDSRPRSPPRSRPEAARPGSARSPSCRSTTSAPTPTTSTSATGSPRR